jgi:hypothetical protein
VTGVCGLRGRGGALPGGGKFAMSRRICSACMRMRDSEDMGIGEDEVGISRNSVSCGVSGKRGLGGIELDGWTC